METSPRSQPGLPYGMMIATGLILGVVVYLAIPQIISALTTGAKTQALNNAKQIHLATTRMVLDASVSPNPKLGWPGDLADVTSVGEFAERLVEYKYFERSDLKSIFAGPVGKPYGTPYTGQGPFRSENSPFKIYGSSLF